MSYPDALEILPLSMPPRGGFEPPGSKSITNRALVLAALCSETCMTHVLRCLCSEDTDVMLTSPKRLGFEIRQRSSDVLLRRGEGKLIPASEADLFVANSGTSMRFLTALVSLGHGRY